MSRVKLNPVLKGRCPICHFEEFHLVSCQLGQSEAENARLQAHIKVLDERGMQASLYVRLCYERDALQARVEEAERKVKWLRDDIETLKIIRQELRAERDRYKALDKMAQLYHEAKHFILGKVDRERFPSYLECPYWPCRDARAFLAQPEGAREAVLEAALKTVRWHCDGRLDAGCERVIDAALADTSPAAAALLAFVKED